MNHSWSLAIFLIIAAVGLFYVKWYPYYYKAIMAVSKHSIGTSILSGRVAAPPAPSWTAAWGYTLSYFKSVWQAVILGLILGSLVEVLLPAQWMRRFLGSDRFRGIALGGMAALPSMMCSCCAAPLAVGMRRRAVSIGSALAYWLGNPVLNPATLVFMGFTLSWRFVILRLVMGVVIVLGVSFMAGKLAGGETTVDPAAEGRQTDPGPGNWAARWWRSFWRLTLDSLPVYLVMVLLLGATRAWLFPAVSPGWGGSVWVIVAFALTGTLFMIPTAAEIPIVQTMMSFGLGVGPAAALLVTLPTVSLPSLLMVRGAFPGRVLVFVGLAVAALGIVSGLLASVILAVF